MENIGGYAVVMLFMVGSISFILLTLLLSKILRPDQPNNEKSKPYESGEEPLGSAWGQFNIRFYIVALVFLLFEAELVFLFPWALVFGKSSLNVLSSNLWVSFTLVETFIFIFILAVGLAYVWKNGMLDWVAPKPFFSKFKSKIPKKMYGKYQ